MPDSMTGIGHGETVYSVATGRDCYDLSPYSARSNAGTAAWTVAVDGSRPGRALLPSGLHIDAAIIYHHKPNALKATYILPTS